MNNLIMTGLAGVAEVDGHIGHSHGGLLSLVDELFEKLPLPHSLQEFFGHIVTDTLNVFFLLIVIMTAVYFISSCINVDKLHHRLASLNSVWGILLAIVIGALTPFCSCSTIPVLMGFISMGVPVSVCLSYLTASSMLNLTAIFGVFMISDWKFGLLYIVCCLIIIILSSAIFAFLKLDSSVKHYHMHDHHDNDGCETLWGRLKNAFSDTLSMFKKCALWIVLGVTLSSAIMAFFSMDSLSAIINSNSVLSSIIASLIGIPIHSDIFSIAAIVELFIAISPAIALSFTFSTMAISLPSVIILTRAIKTKTVLLYCGVIAGLSVVVSIFVALIL